MALGPLPTLTEINTELNTTGQSLVTCIYIAGKEGDWTKQSDFAFWDSTPITVNPKVMDISSSGYAGLNITVVTSGTSWTVNPNSFSWITIINPSGDGNANVVYANIASNTDSDRSAVFGFTDHIGNIVSLTVHQVTYLLP